MEHLEISRNRVNNSPNTNIVSAPNAYIHIDKLVLSSAQVLPHLRTWLCDSARTAHSKLLSVASGAVASQIYGEIIRSPKFEACITQQAATLFLDGNLGSGKSTTANHLIQHLKGRSEIAAASILFDFDLRAEHDRRKVLMRFIYHLVDWADTQQCDCVFRLYKRCPDDIPHANDAADTLSELVQRIVARKAEDGPNSVCFLLDGLNEFSDQWQLRDLLRDLVAIQKKTQCGIIVTARLEDTAMVEILGKYHTVEVTARHQDVKSLVLKSRMSHTVKRMITKRPALLDEISTAVLTSSGGLFLMATLNTFHIVSSRTELECLGSLREVGDTKSIQADGRDDSTLERSVLPHAFDRHINRLLQGSATESERKDGKDILRFLRDVARPIRITELLHMLALRKYQEFDERFLLDPQELLEITQGLVVIGSNDLVSFVHPWLKRHLQRDQRWKDEFSDSSFFLTRSCINYLSWARFASGPCTSKDALEARMNISPFLDYASRYWSTHYGTASGNNFTTSQRSLLTSKVLEFLRRDGHVSSARQILLLPDPVWKNPNRQYVQGLALERSGERLSVHANRALRTKLPGHVDLYEVGLTTGLHLATLLDMGGLVKLMLQQSTSSTIHKLDDLQESLLHLAVAYSNDDLVSYLIDKGADLNQQDHQGLSPWHIAAAYGNTSAVKRMLRQQVGLLNVDAPIIPKRARWQRTSTNNPGPLIITASLWTERASCGSTAMHLAARNGHYEVVAEIIKDGRFHWKIEDEDGMTAFHKACKYGWLEIVKLFVDRGTCPKYRSSKDGRSGLHLACKYPSGFEVAKYLLESFPKLCNEKDSNGETALHHAAAGLDSRAVQLLLDHPSVVIDSANRQGRTPMMLAAFNPNRGFELFLRHKRFDGHKEISIPSVAQLTKKRRSIFDAHPVSEDRSIFSDSSLRSRIAKLQCLAESMSEEGPRPATPLVLENITQTWALGQSSLRS